MKHVIAAYVAFATLIAGYTLALALRHKAVQRRISSFEDE